MAAGCRVSLGALGLALAVSGQSAFAAEQMYRFDIEAQPLQGALREFSRVTREQIAYAASDLRGHRGPSLRGEYSSSAALGRLLGGSGLVSRRKPSGVILIEPARLAEDDGQGAPNVAAGSGGEILVTARKRAEDMLKTPISLSVLTEDAIEKKGIVNLNDVANNTPGVVINNNAAGRSDRSFQQVIIRGFTPSQATNPTAALFIDGTPVASTTAFSALSDPARVEVLKGPQAAYFGRNTFSGAINFVSKTPSDTLSGSVSGMVGTRDNYRVHADMSGPLVDDLLSFRATVNRFGKSGSWRNDFTGETLGDQRTTSGTLQLVATPSSALTIKGFGLLSKDKDGPSAQGLISAYEIAAPDGTVVVPSQSNCTLSGRNSAGGAISNPFICGVTPDLAFGPSQNTIANSYITDFLANPTGRLVSPEDGVKGYGLVRRYYHLHLIADWELGDSGLTISSLTSYNNERYSQFSDIDNYGTTAIPNNGFGPPPPGAPDYFDMPYLVERVNRDFSQEMRLSYDRGGPFTGTLGASYLNAFAQGGLGGGNGALGTSTFSNVDGATRNRTFGLFFGANYEVLPELRVSLEGRYQIDKLYAYAQPTGFTADSDIFVPQGTYAGGDTLLKATYRNFLPRAIVEYDVTPDVMAYASYSKGVNPAAFNVGFLSFSAPLQRAAEAAGLQVRVDPEKVTNYEIGLKGRLFDNRLSFAMAAYYAPWRNQINALTITEFDPVTQSVQIIRATGNTGSVDMKGFEVEGSLALFEHLDIDFAGAYNDSKIKSYENAQVSQLTGITDFSGKENPNTAKYSATLGAQVHGDLETGDGTWYVRGDMTYKSGLWADASNTVRTPSLVTVNTRLGVDFEAFSISAWVRNVFDNETYTSIANTSVLSNNFAYSTYYSGLVVGLPERRTFGLEGKYRF